MEYCEHGNLTQFLKTRRTIFGNEWLAFSEDQNISLSYTDLGGISLQIVYGMEFLVSRKVKTILLNKMFLFSYILIRLYYDFTENCLTFVHYCC